VRGFGFDKACVDDIVGLDIATSVEFHLLFRKPHLLADSLHGSPCAGHGQTNIITVNCCRAPIETFVAGIANKSQTDIGLIADLIHGVTQLIRMPSWYYRFSFFKQNGIDTAQGGVIDTGNGGSTGGIRTQLRLIG